VHDEKFGFARQEKNVHDFREKGHAKKNSVVQNIIFSHANFFVDVHH
jgi:hypothetical protein